MYWLESNENWIVKDCVYWRVTDESMYLFFANSYLHWIVVAEKYVLCMWICKYVIEQLFEIIFFNKEFPITWFLLPLIPQFDSNTKTKSFSTKLHQKQWYKKKIIDNFMYNLTPMYNVIMYQAGLKPILRRRWKKNAVHTQSCRNYFFW